MLGKAVPHSEGSWTAEAPHSSQGFTFRDKVQMLLKHSHISSVMNVGMDFNLSLSRTDLPNELLPGGRHA